MKIFKHYRNTVNLGGRRLIPGHWTLADRWAIIKYHFKYRIWYKYIGKYKIVDSTKYMKIPDTTFFVLTKWQQEKINSLNWKSIHYTIIPTPIGNSVIIKNPITSERIIITDYNSW